MWYQSNVKSSTRSVANQKNSTMTCNGVNPSSQPLVKIFKGENYHLWSLKMKTMFKSQELLDLEQEGFEDANPTKLDQRLRET